MRTGWTRRATTSARSRSRRSASPSQRAISCISSPAATSAVAVTQPAARRTAPSLGDVVGRLLNEARQLVADYAELTVLDARRAAIRLAWILGAVLVAAVLIVTSWMGLVASGIVFAWGQGASWPIAPGIAALINLVAAAGLGWFTFKLAKELPFTALLRQLRGKDPEPPQ